MLIDVLLYCTSHIYTPMIYTRTEATIANEYCLLDTLVIQKLLSSKRNIHFNPHFHVRSLRCDMKHVLVHVHVCVGLHVPVLIFFVLKWSMVDEKKGPGGPRWKRNVKGERVAMGKIKTFLFESRGPDSRVKRQKILTRMNP